MFNRWLYEVKIIVIREGSFQGMFYNASSREEAVKCFFFTNGIQKENIWSRLNVHCMGAPKYESPDVRNQRM